MGLLLNLKVPCVPEKSLIHPLNEGQRETKRNLVMMDLSNAARHVRKAK